MFIFASFGAGLRGVRWKLCIARFTAGCVYTLLVTQWRCAVTARFSFAVLCTRYVYIKLKLTTLLCPEPAFIERTSQHGTGKICNAICVTFTNVAGWPSVIFSNLSSAGLVSADTHIYLESKWQSARP